MKIVSDAFEQRIEKVEEALPPQMKGQARRLVQRAMMTLTRNAELGKCPLQDFVRIVIEAAELGLAIDGKLAWAVRFKSTWQLIVSYQGLVAVARRGGVLKDVFGDVVCENDYFEAWREGATSHLKHRIDLGKRSRGEVVAAYAVFVLPDGGWRYELMNREELDKIQQRAPSKSGPWSTDRPEMQKKSVIRRGMKLYSDDPGVARALEVDDRAAELERLEAEPAAAPPPDGRQSLRSGAPRPPAALEPANGHGEGAPAGGPPEAPAQPAPPEMTQEQSEEALALDDWLADRFQRVGAADGEPELDAVLAEADAQRDWIGKANHAKVARAVGERRKQLAAQPRERPEADF